ncbi:MAG: gliding motility lipoprotein GldH [Bacteroidia bacterium]|nr:gliding motility lipoprotein GldH [Bacteroidia bacterium]MCZ2249513.1 gliding motility lipoprotein GldH [Bacteroidia bacterium]
MKKVIILAFIVLVSLLISCDSKRVYEENIDIPDYIWDVNNPVYFDVQIDDTVSLHNIYINIRNASGYGYSNIYLFLDTKYPDNTISRDTIECILADPSGKWLGNGSGDIWDNQILFKKNVRFKQKGKYNFRYEQAMRTPKLPMIMDVGLRIEKE